MFPIPVENQNSNNYYNDTFLGVEDVSMFNEDHIDPWSDLPLAHFSFMLKKIVPISCLETAAYFKATYCEDSDQVN